MIIAGVVLPILTGSLVYLGNLYGANNLYEIKWRKRSLQSYLNIAIITLIVVFFLTTQWLPVGTQAGIPVNFVFVTVLIAVILAVLWLMVIYYERMLRWCLDNRWEFMAIPLLTLLFGITIWLGFDKTFGFVAKGFETVGWKSFRQTAFWSSADEALPGIGQEFMPALDEGSFC